MRKIISLVMIICLLMIPLVEVQAIASFSSVFGGAIYGKQALAFMTVVTGLGIDFVTQNDAIEMFNDLRTSAPSVIADMVDIVKESWLGAYSTVTAKLISVKNAIYDYLLDKFGTVEVGSNELVNYLHFEGYNITFIDDNGILRCIVNGVLSAGLFANPMQNIVVKSILPPYYSGNSLRIPVSVSFYNPITGKQINDSTFTAIYNLSELNELEEPIPTLSVNISSDAGVIDGNFDPDNREPVILPPPYVPGLDLQDVSNPNGSISKHFDGTIDDYMEHAADNNTWSDIQEYLNTGTNTTTLTQTATGLNVGLASAVPYPDTNIDVPDVITGIGTIGGLIQAVINWLSQLANSISNIFAIPTDLTLNFDSLRLVDFKNKFPFSIPWDLYNAINVFARTPETPDLTINFDTEYLTVNHVIDISRIQLPLMFARYTAIVFFIIFLISKTRDLIKW